MKQAIASMASLLVLTGVGSFFELTLIPYVVFGVICAVTVLVTLNKIKAHEYPVYIFGMSLALLWQTSMMGSYIVGADIHSELFVANRAIAEGWDWNFQNTSNVSIVTGLLVPLLARIGFTAVWQFKAIYPAVFACVPLILYFAYRKMMGEKRAYFATLFFVVVPVFFVEIVGIVKSMVAEVFLALMVLFIVVDIESWKKAIGIGLTALLAMSCHYTIGTLAILFLAGSLIVLLVTRLVHFGWLKDRRMSLLHLSLAFVCILAVGVMWLSSAAQGMMWDTHKDIVRNLVKNATVSMVDVPPPSTTELPMSSDGLSYLYSQEPLVRTAIGLDFATATFGGKLFRIMQYLTQGLLVLGFVYLLFRYRYYTFTAEFTSLAMVGYGLLAMCVFLPSFSTLINASRFYQVSLFFIAPMLVVGVEQLNNDIGALSHKIVSDGEAYAS